MSFTIFAPPSVSSEDVIALIGSENVFGNYKTQLLDDGSPNTYVGQMKTTGEWLITLVIDTSGDLDIQYANLSNNLTETTLASAWTNRATLAYTLISNLTGV